MSSIQIPSVENVNIELLKVDSQNPNVMTKQEHERLASSIKKYGFIVPIITNRDLLIADGEQRWMVAKSLGMTEVPIIRLDVEDVDRRLLRQVLNKLRGEHELVADALEFEKIISAGREEDLKHLLDLTDGNLERYLSEIHEPNPEDYEIPEIDKVQTDIKRGDVFSLGVHRLMCGDAIYDSDQLLSSKPRLIFADPPYGVAFGKSEMKRTKASITAGTTGFKNYGNIEGDETLSTTTKWLESLGELANGTIYLCCAGRHIHKIKQKLDELGIYCATPLVWVKEHWVMSWERYHAQHENILFCGEGAHPTGKKSIWYGKTNETTVWQIKRECSLHQVHPTQKPTELISKAIRNSSLMEDIVYDPFGGSGSTLIACEQTGRTCYMMEIEPRYVQIIINRWEAYTGKKAVKLLRTVENHVPTNNHGEDS